MMKKMLGVFTAVVTALAIVGVAYAGTDDEVSASGSAATEGSGQLSVDDSSSTGASFDSSTSATVDASVSMEGTVDGSTSATVEGTTSATVDASTSTSIDDSDDDDTTTSTTIESTTSTSFDDSDSRLVPDGVATYQISGVGAVTIEAVAGQLVLVNVFAPGWEIEEQRVEADRVELELVSGEAEAEFQARINSGEIEVRTRVDSD